MESSKMTNFVVGLSGGIDSALVAAILGKLPKKYSVHFLSLPMYVSGVTDQDLSVRDSWILSEWIRNNSTCYTSYQKIDLTDCQLGVVRAFPGSAWEEGQLSPILRTAVLYYTANKRNAIVVGTTNRDEGAYIGFFGKASDGMNDLQLISDLHKSEVYILAKYLQLPDLFLNREPKGDVFDGRSDYQMIGATYDEVELYMSAKDNPSMMNLLEEDLSLKEPFRNIENLHQKNLHKYWHNVGSYSIHLDVMERKVFGGWNQDSYVPPFTEESYDSIQVAGKRTWDYHIPDLKQNPVSFLEYKIQDLPVRILSNALSEQDCQSLAKLAFSDDKAVPVNVFGFSYGDNRNAVLKLADKVSDIGSIRNTFISKELADKLWLQIKAGVPTFLQCTDFSATDWNFIPSSKNWRAVGLSPMLRFMKYEKGGKHCPHYDASYSYPDGIRRTLLSVVFYLSSSDEIYGGSTRIISDGQDDKKTHERDYSDWNFFPKESDIILKSYPKAGNVLVFGHRICHDVEEYTGSNPRIIIRADVVYERI